VARFSHA